MDIRALTPTYAVSPQIDPEDLPAIKAAGYTVVIDNRPDGEIPPHLHTPVMEEAAKAGKLVSVAGGGDTVAALNHAGVADDFTYISTAGGAFLEWMEGKELPGVVALQTV